MTNPRVYGTPPHASAAGWPPLHEEEAVDICLRWEAGEPVSIISEAYGYTLVSYAYIEAVVTELKGDPEVRAQNTALRQAADAYRLARKKALDAARTIVERQQLAKPTSESIQTIAKAKVDVTPPRRTQPAKAVRLETATETIYQPGGGGAKLTDDQVREIRRRKTDDPSLTAPAICADYGVSKELIGRIWRGAAYAHVQGHPTASAA